MSLQSTDFRTPAVEMAAPQTAARPHRDLYFSVPEKFMLALTLAAAWVWLSVWLSQRWLADLAHSVTS